MEVLPPTVRLRKPNLKTPFEPEAITRPLRKPAPRAPRPGHRPECHQSCCFCGPNAGTGAHQ